MVPFACGSLSSMAFVGFHDQTENLAQRSKGPSLLNSTRVILNMPFTCALQLIMISISSRYRVSNLFMHTLLTTSNNRAYGSLFGQFRQALGAWAVSEALIVKHINISPDIARNYTNRSHEIFTIQMLEKKVYIVTAPEDVAAVYKTLSH